MRGIKDNVVIVTGGAQGIGKATCEMFAQHGAKVVIADLDEKHGRNTENEFLKKSYDVKYIQVDISSEDSIKNLMNKTVSHYQKIDSLVNCAGSFIFKSIDATVEDWNTMLNINVIGTALCVKHAVPEMIKSGKGSIVNIASISGFIAQPNYLTYNTCKAALVNMTRCMALDLAQYNIRVNAVNPGTVWTENNAFYTLRDRGLNKEQANAHPEIGGAHMLNRVAEPQEIASAILFLISEEASFITAENLMVDGGYTAV